MFAEGEDLEYPNGLLVEGDSLVVGGWGKAGSRLHHEGPWTSLQARSQNEEEDAHHSRTSANIDGLESDGKGGYVVTDYLAGKILHVSSDGKITTLTTFMPGTADIAFTPAENRLIVPHMNENKIVAYDISGALQ